MANAEDSALTRKTTNLTPKAMRALGDLVDQEFAANDTDAMNRALVMTAFLVGEVQAGAQIHVVRPGEPPLAVVFL